MAVKTFNYTNDRYIEGEDTRAQNSALLRNNGYGFKGNIARVESTNTYVVTAGSIIFIGGLCVRVLTDEAFDLSSDRYIVVETSYESLTDKYICVLKSVETIDISIQGEMVKHYPLYDETIGIMNELKEPVPKGCTWGELAGEE